MVKLADLEQAMLAGEAGEPRQRAMEHLVQVADFFGATDMVEASQAHIMADSEALGESGVAFLENLAAAPMDQRLVRIPTITDPRGADFKAYGRIRQDQAFVELERRTVRAFEALGVMMTDTCINYQTIMPPVLGEHLAFGDTGSVIYANSVLGARSNFEGGPSALSAALTGRVPRYGFHLEACRRGTHRFRLEAAPRNLNDWGAAGALVGRAMSSYWNVPVIEGVEAAPGSDALKHFGAALASFGSTPLFHMPGVTPEAPSSAAVFDGEPPPARAITEADLAALHASYAPSGDGLDVVVFAAPQLSLFELRALTGLLDGRELDPGVTLIAAVPPDVKSAADRMGLTGRFEASGALLLEGVCFYQMHAREIGRANGWHRLMTNSAKLVNIIGGYGYEPVLASMARCVDCAVAGRVL